MENEAADIELRSEEVEDILGKVPSWIVRWGTIVILVIVGVLLAGGWLFSYPDIKSAGIEVTTEHPPYTLLAKSTGKIEKLFVSDNQKVKAGAHLGLIENPADYDDVVELTRLLAELRRHLPDFSRTDYQSFGTGYSLGEVQQSYAQFIKLYRDYLNFISLDIYAHKIEALRNEIDRYRNQLGTLKKQSRILGGELELAKVQFTRDSSLYVKKAYAEADMDRARTVMLQKQYDYEQSLLNITSTGIRISELNRQILDLELTGEDAKKKQEFSLMEAYENLNAQLAIWKQKYLLASPIAGVVSFTRIWSENQNVREGDKVMTVIPEHQGEIIGKIYLQIDGAGKVRTGQRVNIQFANYPHRQFGMVGGIVRSISQVPNDEQYLVEVGLPEGLVTYYGLKIPFSQEMQGRAEIVTDERSLIERIVSPFKSVISEQQQSRKAD